MYNVSLFWHYIPLPLLSYGIFKLSSEINKRYRFQQYLSVSTFSQEIFSGIRVIKAYSLEDQHQNNMVSLAKE
jgi:ATP-binding cassette subfamily B protein